jgi:hypothetical protein
LLTTGDGTAALKWGSTNAYTENTEGKTNGIDKPALNLFRMLGQMRGERVAVENTSTASIEAIRDAGVRGNSEFF